MRRFAIKTVGLMAAKDVDKSGTIYSDSVDTKQASGPVGALLISTAGAISVNQEASKDNITFYDPINNQAAAQGVVCTGMTVTTGTWVTFTPVVTPYTRFKVVETGTAASKVSITYIIQEET
jgi:hypothetical protein